MLNLLLKNLELLQIKSVFIFNNYCIQFQFKIRKLVSTRYDLNQPKYQVLIPQLDLIEKLYTYEQV